MTLGAELGTFDHLPLDQDREISSIVPNRMNLSGLLNDRQLEAATTLDGPLLIIAGAGSGKTRTITYRIAYMLAQGIPQSHILALTFTNKAAREMTERVREVTGKKLTNLTTSTFHAFGVKILHEQIHTLGYRPNFSIYDQVDKTEMIRTVARELSVSRDSIDLFALSALFSGIKTKRTTWESANDQYRELYEEYQGHLKAYNAVDFDDLIMLPVEIFESSPEALEHYRERYRYIMVDEYQDIDERQYALVSALAGRRRAAPRARAAPGPGLGLAVHHLDGRRSRLRGAALRRPL